MSEDAWDSIAAKKSTFIAALGMNEYQLEAVTEGLVSGGWWRKEYMPVLDKLIVEYCKTAHCQPGSAEVLKTALTLAVEAPGPPKITDADRRAEVRELREQLQREAQEERQEKANKRLLRTDLNIALAKIRADALRDAIRTANETRDRAKRDDAEAEKRAKTEKCVRCGQKYDPTKNVYGSCRWHTTAAAVAAIAARIGHPVRANLADHVSDVRDRARLFPIQGVLLQDF